MEVKNGMIELMIRAGFFRKLNLGVFFSIAFAVGTKTRRRPMQTARAATLVNILRIATSFKGLLRLAKGLRMGQKANEFVWHHPHPRRRK